MRELYKMLNGGDAVDLTRFGHFDTLLEATGINNLKKTPRAKSAAEHGKLFA